MREPGLRPARRQGGAVGQCNEGARNPFCASLCEGTRSALCAVARESMLGRGDILPVAAVPDRVGVVRRGALAMLVDAAVDSGWVGSYIAGSGDIGNLQRLVGDCGEYGVRFNEGDYAYALVPTSLCLIPVATMRALFSDDPDFAFKVFAQMTDRYKNALERLLHVSKLSVEDRIRWLFGVLDKQGVDTSRLTHEQIAHVLGVNRVTVTKLMKSI